MGFREINIQLPADYSKELLRHTISRNLKIKNFVFQITNKSLDARHKKNIFWQLRLQVFSDELTGEKPPPEEILRIPYRRRNKKITVVGSGPAGFFSALLLQEAGFPVTIMERGAAVDKRAAGIHRFERSGLFDPICNYAFGEGGAGTFSDGKLTSRSKHISLEKRFILTSYVEAGAPEEILYLAHPHLGSDNLRKIVKNLRRRFQEKGGKIVFESTVSDIKVKKGNIRSVISENGETDSDYLIVASGHSAYDTFRMLMKRGVRFRLKNFAIGHRVEHSQGLINLAQWGIEALSGVKAAEYRLTSKNPRHLPVYTFCMCPGGMVVPATAFESLNIVNGMSLYNRNGKFANAACIAGVHPEKLAGEGINPAGMLSWLENLERKFYDYSGGYQAPFCTIPDYIRKKETASLVTSSYPLGLKPAPLWEMLPPGISQSIRSGLQDFSRKLKGFEEGIILGLESKSSSPLQTERTTERLCPGFDNLYLAGEGSGYTGGIISSAADGLKVARHIIESNE